MKIESQKVDVSTPQKECYLFLASPSNYKCLMPDSVKHFESDEDKFRFTIDGMPEIQLKLIDKEPYSKLVLQAEESKIPFMLTINILSNSEPNSQVKILFEGTVNPMMAMMVKKPLQKFLDTLASKCATNFAR